MREKLNSNPIAQAALVIVLLLAAGFFLLGGMGGGEEEETAATEPTSAETAVASAVGEEGAATTAVAPIAAPVGAIPAAPLPAPVERAYKSDKTVVLLIVHDGGIDDQLVATSVRSLSGQDNTAIFVVPADQVARYSAVTLGLEVNRVPALIVMRPRSLSEGTPQASVTYGFQSKQAIVQAVRDATYNGPEATYYPN